MSFIMGNEVEKKVEEVDVAGAVEEATAVLTQCLEERCGVRAVQPGMVYFTLYHRLLFCIFFLIFYQFNKIDSHILFLFFYFLALAPLLFIFSIPFRSRPTHISLSLPFSMSLFSLTDRKSTRLNSSHRR